MSILPVQRLSIDEVPAKERGWVERALMSPLNRDLLAIDGALGRVPTSRQNMQIIEHRGFPPSASDPLEVLSTLTGPCLALYIGYAAQLDTGGVPSTPVGGLTSPTWEEVALSGRTGSKLKISAQGGLTPTTRYAVRWLAVGG